MTSLRGREYLYKKRKSSTVNLTKPNLSKTKQDGFKVSLREKYGEINEIMDEA